jgi:integrase
MGRLTPMQVKAAKTGRLTDGDGLMLVMRENGARRWVLRIQAEGRRRDFTLGEADTSDRTAAEKAASAKIDAVDRKLLTLAEAREKADAYRWMVKAGLDPIEERKKAPATIPTFERATRDCHEEMKAGWRNDKHTKVWLACMETHAFPVIGDKPVDTIDSIVVRDLLAPIWLDKQETSRRLLQRIGVVLDFAHIKGWRPAETSLKSVRKGLPRHKRDDSHFHAMPYQDVPAFLEKVRGEVHTAGRDGLEFTILTAVRSNETRFARWPEIDMRKAIWTIPGERMKTGVTHVVPLAPAAITILKRRWEGRTENDGLVFFSTPRKPMSDMTMTKALRTLGEDAAHVHGFRSAFTDWAAEMTDVAKEVVDKALAHKLPDKVEAAYRRTNHLERRRVLMTMWADYLAGGESVPSAMSA